MGSRASTTKLFYPTISFTFCDTTGVYGIVRNPMYAGAVLLMIGMPLWLESYAAALFAIVPIILLAVRIVFEEQFLRQELSGYDAYTERVRYKLLPYVW
jgi:protein-S-isoprenylcysteine O-methyltransferase Ste14